MRKTKIQTRPDQMIDLPPVQYTKRGQGTAHRAWTTPDMGRRGWGVSPPFTVSVWLIVFIVLLIVFL